VQVLEVALDTVARHIEILAGDLELAAHPALDALTSTVRGRAGHGTAGQGRAPRLGEGARHPSVGTTAVSGIQSVLVAQVLVYL